MKNTNDRNTNCEIIRDLMPLCSEGLCSEDSKALIEEHIRTCEECRKLYEGLPADVVADAAVPEESKALRKVNKKLKFGKAWLILLIALVLGLGYLTVGQFAKVEFIQSFETLWRNVEVYPIARMIAKGDFESFNEWVTTSDLDNLYIYKDFDEIRAQDVENLKATYKEAYGDTTVKRIKVRSFYTENYAKRSKLIGSEIEIRYENGDMLGFWLGKGVDGLYYGEISTYDNEKAVNF
ncbi:MAG: zf-HC2 domain-containing protein, partial [Clostridia bacterium]|nr:zf-HC2 domain-containing protein [Clostridia bacterium]